MEATAGSAPAPDARLRRLYLLLGAGALGVVLAAAVWILVTGLLARSELEATRHDISRLRAAISTDDTAAARPLAARIAAESASAHQHTLGPAWWTAANLPLLGTPLRTARVIAAQTDQVSTGVLPPLTRIVDEVRTEHHPSAGVDMALLAQAAPTLRDASTAVHHAQQAIAAAPSSWLGMVSGARTAALSSLSRVTGEVDTANKAVDILSPMLGSTRPQRYFIGFLNEAESRALGGIAGAFAIVTVDHGAVRFEHFGTDGDLHGVSATVDLGAQYNAVYQHNDPTSIFQNSDLSPDFRNAAQIWAGLWAKKSGQHIDGAISVDPTALSYLLRATGPATLPDGGTVSAANVVALTQQRQYSLFPSTDRVATAQRKAYLTSVAQAVAARLLRGASLRALFGALSDAARERRLSVWSAQPAVEDDLISVGWSGAFLPAPGRAFSSFVVNNSTGGKLDYYLERRMSLSRTSCQAGSRAVATFTLTDDAPPSGLPPYVTLRLDAVPPGARVGDTSLLVTYYATPGASIERVTVDGTPIILATAHENGLPLVTTLVQLKAGVPTTVQVTTREPATHGAALIVRQPLVRSMSVDSGRAC